MAEIIKNLKKGFIQGTGIVIAMFVGGALYVFANSLTATDGETLTATKWNALVDKVNTIETTSTGYDYDSGWFDVGTTSAGYGGSTTNSVRNVYAKTHNLNSKNLDVKVLFRVSSTSDAVYSMENYMQIYVTTNRTCFGPYIEYLDNNIINVLVRYSGCTSHYVSPYVMSKTTGQYRVLIKKLP